MAGLGQLRLEVFRGLTGLEALHADWTALFDRIAHPSYLQLWEWHWCCLKAGFFEPDNSFYGAVYDGSRLIAVIPLVHSMRRRLGVPLQFLTLPYSEIIPHADIVAEPGDLAGLDPSALLRALRRELSVPWDALGFGRVLETSATNVLLQGSRGFRDGLLFVTRQVDSNAVLKVAPYEEMFAGLSKNLRSSLRRARGKLAKLDGVEFRWAHRPDELAEAFPHFLAIEASGWKGKAGTAIQSDCKLRALFGGLVANLGPSGRCRVNLLMQGGQVLAAQFGLVTSGCYHLLKSGYDQSYAKLSPSNLLIDSLLQKLAEEPQIRTVDLISDQDWQRSWRPIRQPVLMHYFCRPGPRGAAIWAAARLSKTKSGASA